MIIGFAIPRFGSHPGRSEIVSGPPPAFLMINGGPGQMVVEHTGTLTIAGGFEQISLEVV